MDEYRMTLRDIILDLGEVKKEIDKDKTSKLYYKFDAIWNKLMIYQDQFQKVDDLYDELDGLRSELDEVRDDFDYKVDELRDEIEDYVNYEYAYKIEDLEQEKESLVGAVEELKEEIELRKKQREGIYKLYDM